MSVVQTLEQEVLGRLCLLDGKRIDLEGFLADAEDYASLDVVEIDKERVYRRIIDWLVVDMGFIESFNTGDKQWTIESLMKSEDIYGPTNIGQWIRKLKAVGIRVDIPEKIEAIMEMAAPSSDNKYSTYLEMLLKLNDRAHVKLDTLTEEFFKITYDLKGHVVLKGNQLTRSPVKKITDFNATFTIGQNVFESGSVCIKSSMKQATACSTQVGYKGLVNEFKLEVNDPALLFNGDPESAKRIIQLLEEHTAPSAYKNRITQGSDKGKHFANVAYSNLKGCEVSKKMQMVRRKIYDLVTNHAAEIKGRTLFSPYNGTWLHLGEIRGIPSQVNVSGTLELEYNPVSTTKEELPLLQADKASPNNSSRSVFRLPPTLENSPGVVLYCPITVQGKQKKVGIFTSYLPSR